MRLEQKEEELNVLIKAQDGQLNQKIKILEEVRVREIIFRLKKRKRKFLIQFSKLLNFI